MSEKIAVRGLSRVSFFEVLKNNYDEYEVGEQIRLPYVQNLARDVNVDSATIHADDGVYMTFTDYKGTKFSIELAQLELDLMEKLGYGKRNKTTGEFSISTRNEQKSFGVTFACKRTDGSYRMYRIYNLQLDPLAEGNNTTLGENNGLHSYTITGTAGTRAMDDKIYEVLDSNDLTWLNTITGSSPDTGVTLSLGEETKAKKGGK